MYLSLYTYIYIYIHTYVFSRCWDAISRCLLVTINSIINITSLSITLL